eukprot:TRINITY_DN16196_c0_g1_i1.p1 TRINITY_DN16196_c0_g1~~TRINITY_DN16196_c0_g1_i1.p1  ORF type:complete len:447 (-),score=69.97 TRINITY_DN16196_c0_g1_i1:75-1415(-)
MRSLVVLCALVAARAVRLGDYEDAAVEGRPRFTEAELAAMRGKTSGLKKKFHASPAEDKGAASRPPSTGKRLQCSRLAQVEDEDKEQQNAARQKQCLRMAAELRSNAANKRLHCDWSEELNVCFNTDRAEAGESEAHASARKNYRESHEEDTPTDFAEGGPGEGASMGDSTGQGDSEAGAAVPGSSEEDDAMDDQQEGALVPNLLMFVKASIPQEEDSPSYRFYAQLRMGSWKWKTPAEKRFQGNDVRWQETLASLLVQPEEELQEINLWEDKPNTMNRRYIREKNVKPTTQTLTQNGASLSLTSLPLLNWAGSEVGGRLAGAADDWRNANRVVVFEAATGLPKMFITHSVYVTADILRASEKVAAFKSLKVRGVKQGDGTYSAMFERHTSGVLLAAGETLGKVRMMIHKPNTLDPTVLTASNISARSKTVTGEDGVQLTVRVVPL